MHGPSGAHDHGHHHGHHHHVHHLHHHASHLLHRGRRHAPPGGGGQEPAPEDPDRRGGCLATPAGIALLLALGFVVAAILIAG
jgi:hypothetical protein